MSSTPSALTPAQQAAVLAQMSAAFTPANQAALASSIAANPYLNSLNTSQSQAATQQAIINDLNSGNFQGAFNSAGGYNALSSAQLATDAFNSTGQVTNANSAPTQGGNPFYDYLDSAQGLQSLDPSLQWNQSSINAYYQAALANENNLGQDPLEALGTGQTWGAMGASAATADALQQIAAYGSSAAPNLDQFAGENGLAANSGGFWNGLGNDIYTYLPAVALAVAAPYAVPALAGEGAGVAATAAAGAAYGAGSTVAIDGTEGTPITGKGVALGALTGAAGAASPGVTNYINQATGIGTTAAGALYGAGIGAAKGALSGSGAGTGAVLGGISGAIQGSGIRGTASGAISNATGIGSGASNALTNTGLAAGQGALASELHGGSATTGAAGGALSATSGAITGSIFGSGNTILNSGNAAGATPSNNASPGGYNTYDDGGIDPFGTDSSQGYLNNTPYLTTGVSDQDALQNSVDPYNPGYTNLAVQGGGSTLGGGYNSGSSSSGSSSLLSGLASLFGGGGSGNGSSSGGLASLLGGSNGSNGLLAQLLGAGVNAAAGVVNQQAAQGAAQTFANQTAFKPYTVNTSGGSASFNGTNATTALSSGGQQTYTGLQGLTDSSAASLQAGPQAAQTQYYNELQASQADANNKYFQNNLDSQFANGILSSTAGQYQSQAALANISQQQLSDQAAAINYSSTQQQNQLSQLTAGLNGINSINSNQNALASLGGSLGYQGSNVNLQAYKPLAGANANSPLGNILSSIGNQYNNSATSP